MEAAEDKPSSASGRWQRYRLGLVLLLFIGLYVVGEVTGLTEQIDREQIRQAIDEAGPFGGLLFIVIFCLGELVHIPGLVFIGAGILAYGKLLGGLLSFVAGVCSVTFSFVLVRGVGGQVIQKSKNKWLSKMLTRLDERPISTIVLLRTILWLAPPLNYALALSKIRLRDYVVGSALGLAFPVALITTFFGWLFG